MKVLSKIFLIAIMCCVIIPSALYGDNSYFDWPIPFNEYDPYSFNGRSLGAINHTGEDIALSSESTIRSIGEGDLAVYQSDGCWVKRLSADYCNNSSGIYCGYGVLYGIVQYTLDRQIKVPIGRHSTTISNEFSFSYGHIMKSADSSNPLQDDTGLSVGDSLLKDDIIGYIAPAGTSHCGANDYNGDGEEHLHFGCKPGHVTLVSGYGDEQGYCPAHLVIAASQIGVYSVDSNHADPYWNSINSQAFTDAWWGEYKPGETHLPEDTDDYRFMDLENYKSILGLPWNNGKTQFVHPWPDNGSGESIPGFNDTLWVQDLLKDNGDGTYNWNWLVLNNKNTSDTSDDEVFAVRHGLLQHYFSSSGYSIYGPPNANQTDEVYEGETPLGTDDTNIRVQPFAKIACYLGINDQDQIDYYEEMTNGKFRKISDRLKDLAGNYTDGIVIESTIHETGRFLEFRYTQGENCYSQRYNLSTGAITSLSMVKSTPKKGFGTIQTHDIDGDGVKENITIHSSDSSRNFRIYITPSSGGDTAKEIIFPTNNFRPSWISIVEDKNNSGSQDICVHGRESGVEKTIYFDAKSGALIP